MRYRCTDCNATQAPPLAELAQAAAVAAHRGQHQPDGWWVPVLTWPKFQAEIVAWLRHGDLRCHYHAELLGELVVMACHQVGAAGGQVPAELLEGDGGEPSAQRGG